MPTLPTPRALLSFTLPLALVFSSLPGWAQTPPPPPMPAAAALEAELEPQVTIVQKDGNREEEYRLNGRLYMIKVTPKEGGKPYYLIDTQGGGTFTRQDSLDTGNRIPLWVVHQF